MTVRAVQAPVLSHVQVAVQVLFKTGRWVWITDPRFFIRVFQCPN